MSLTWQSTTSAENGAGTTPLAPSKPTGTAAGDLLYVHIEADHLVTAITPPTGFTQIDHQDNGIGKNSAWNFRKVADGTEGTTLSFSSTGGNMFTVSATRYTGTSIAADTGASAHSKNGATTGTTLTALAVTTSLSSETVVVSFGAWAATANFTDTGTYTVRANVGQTSGDYVQIGDFQKATAGGTGNQTATQNVSDAWDAFMVAFQDSGSGGGTVVEISHLLLLGCT